MQLLQLPLFIRAQGNQNALVHLHILKTRSWLVANKNKSSSARSSRQRKVMFSFTSQRFISCTGLERSTLENTAEWKQQERKYAAQFPQGAYLSANLVKTLSSLFFSNKRRCSLTSLFLPLHPRPFSISQGGFLFSGLLQKKSPLFADCLFFACSLVNTSRSNIHTSFDF